MNQNEIYLYLTTKFHTMKNVTLIILLVFSSVLWSQSTGGSNDSNKSQPTPVSTQKTNYIENYRNTKSNFINKYSKEISIEDQKQLDQIVEQAKEENIDSYEYYYLEYLNRGKSIEAFQYLEKAALAYPKNVDFFDDFIYHYELTNQKNLRANYSKKLFESNTIHDALMEYNYNVLMSIEENGILITNGSDDTFPIFVLQDVKKTRTDVTVINIDMLEEQKYINQKSKDAQLNIKKQKNTLETLKYIIKNNPKSKIYIGHTVNQKILQEFQKNLYLSGLTYQYATTPINNVEDAVAKYEKNFKTDQLKRPTSNKSINQLNFNYTLPLITFIEYYKSVGDIPKYESTKALLLEIANKVGKQTFIENYISEKGL